MPPLGYDVKDRKLVVNDSEARTVVGIYRRYLALKSVHALEDALAGAGIRSKRRAHADGTEYGGQKLSRGALYLMLQNRIYRGEITHKTKSYPGEHQAIIEQPLWDEVQAVFAKNRIERATGTRAKHASLLADLVFDETGGRLTPTYAVKKGTRYRYYVSTTHVTGAGRDRPSARRIPASNLEGLVIDKIRSFFADPGAVLDAFDETHSGSGQRQLIERGRQVAEELQAQAANEIKAILVALACRVEINPDRIEIEISQHRLAAFLTRQSIDQAMQDHKPDRYSDDVVTLTTPARLMRVGREMRLLVDNFDDHTAPDPSLLRFIARAHDIQTRLTQNTKLTVHDIARDERVSAAHIYNLLRLPWLAPDITAAIINGRQPPRFNAMKLMRQASRATS